ncbi:MAG: PocR ligand-binding domain-containing protein [Eubacterium sp.]|nr:PocR ligand-binding domain-containing protein [Eubacterium sp.]
MKITDIIDVDVLQKIQDSFSDATGFATITVDYKGNPITKYSNFSGYCTKVREDNRCLECCYRSDAHGGIESARSGKPSIYICHGGLVDLAVPIMVKGNYLGAIMSGQVRIDEEGMKNLPLGSVSELTDFSNNENSEELEELYDKTLVTSLKQVHAAADLLYTIANYLVEKQMIHIMQEELHNKNLELMEEVKLRSEVEAALKEADLKALQAQINPHFLFNVLNTIGRLALLENAEKTQEMIYAFSDMMRYTLKKENSNIVSLKEEIEHVKNYLSIQKMRLGDRLEYHIHLEEDAEETMCPFMTVQPFVENAINHAIEPNVAGGKITITAEMQNELTMIHIIDDGKGIKRELIDRILDGTYESSPETGDKNTGIGINNANKRLQYYYGAEYGVAIESDLGHGTDVLIKIPRKALLGRGLDV